MPQLCDRDLRAALRARTARLHADDYGARVVEELDLGNARADVVVLNGRIEGFEIKSDRDSLVKLAHQAPAYEAVCDRVWLVTTERYVAAAADALPNWWGLLVARGTGDGLRLVRRRRACAHRAARPEALAALLWRDELLALCDRAGLAVRRSATVPVLVEVVGNSLSSRRLADEVRGALVAREGWRAVPPSASGGASSRPASKSAGSRVGLPPHRRR